MTGSHDATPRFEWRHRQDDGWTWSNAHTTDGPCSGCCPTNALSNCPRCGGRLHRDIAIIDNRLSGALFCQQERTDDHGRPKRMRQTESAAQVTARVAMARQENRERVDQWIGRAMGGVLAAKVAFAAVFVVIVLLGLLPDW